MVAFGKPLYRAGLLNRWLLLRALYGQLVYLYLGADEERMARMRTKVLALTAGWDQAHVSSIVAETLEEVIEPIVFDEALQLIEEHRAAGRRVYIISASPEEIVLPLARYLGVDEAIATQARTDAHGRYTGEVAFYAYGPFKAERMAEVAERARHRPGRLLRLLRLHHRRAHALGGRPPGGGEPGPRPGQGGRRAGLGRAVVHPQGPPPRAGQHAAARSHRGGRRGHRRDGGGRAPRPGGGCAATARCRARRSRSRPSPAPWPSGASRCSGPWGALRRVVRRTRRRPRSRRR